MIWMVSWSTVSQPERKIQRGSEEEEEGKSAEASNGLKHHASFLSAGYPVDGSLGHEGADLLSTQRWDPNSESQQAARNET
ncbi:hypothetical protein ILYODFUR_008753 [Ilyodon furcidens]|uniref:Uncharacterized protein n=1 Tax=Ilyodon furcidens TaxID=33524 RepID=A0ABV0SWK7_9TELE